MAENPATWGQAEKIIDAAYHNWWVGQDQLLCGLSLPRQIADALRAAGFDLSDREELQWCATGSATGY